MSRPMSGSGDRHDARVLYVAYCSACGVVGDPQLHQCDADDDAREHNHENTPRCTCYDPATAEWAPEPCPACKAEAS